RHRLRSVPDARLLHGRWPAGKAAGVDRIGNAGHGCPWYRRPLMIRAITLLLVLLLASACSSLRPYTPPKVAPAAMVNADPALVNTQPLDLHWGTKFGDPVLDGLLAGA